MDDTISRQAAIDMFQNLAYDDWNQGVSTSWADAYSECANMIRELPSAHTEDWMERNKERILQAGMEGREVEFYIGGRLFAIREIAQ